MHESPSASAGAGLLAHAALYARGELDAARAAAFETLLESNTAAQAALCQAVQRELAVRGLPARPDPAYRTRVRRRLRPPRRGFRRVLPVGLVAALVLFALSWGPSSWQWPRAETRDRALVLAPAVPPESTELESDLELACCWAELSELDESHLARTHEELLRNGLKEPPGPLAVELARRRSRPGMEARTVPKRPRPAPSKLDG